MLSTGQQTLKEVSSTDAVTDLRRSILSFRGNGSRWGFERGQPLVMAVREVAEHALPTWRADELWHMILGRRFEAFGQDLEYDPLARVESLR